LIDRIDLQVYVRALTGEQMLASASSEPSSVVRDRVLSARELQKERFARSDRRLNAAMSPPEVMQFCELSRAGKDSIRQAVDSFGLSARAFDRILKVARTMADLEGGGSIKEAHLHEAIQYRILESQQP
jgi:magnesium chelatase family protein